MLPPAAVCVCAGPADDAVLYTRADDLARELHLPRVATVDQAPPGTVLVLAVTAARLELHIVGGEDAAIRGGRAVAIDWASIDTRSGPGRSLRQPLARAVGLGKGRTPPEVIDATAGFGGDAWLLASLGCQVTMIERQGVLAAMLEDALERMRRVEPQTAGHMRVVRGNGVTLLPAIIENSAPESVVVYLDPMFPSARKAAQSKAMKVLRMLAGDNEDSAALLAAARRVARRVVVKRPRHAPPVGGTSIQPVAVHRGKAVRFDVYCGEG